VDPAASFEDGGSFGPVQTGITILGEVEVVVGRRDDIAPLAVRTDVGEHRSVVVVVAFLDDRVDVRRHQVIGIGDGVRAMAERHLLGGLLLDDWRASCRGGLG